MQKARLALVAALGVAGMTGLSVSMSACSSSPIDEGTDEPGADAGSLPTQTGGAGGRPSGAGGAGGAGGSPATGGAGGSSAAGGSGGSSSAGGGGGSSTGGAGGAAAGGSGGGGGVRDAGASGGAGGSSGGRDAGGSADARRPAGDAGATGRFSFFYTSLDAMRRLSGSQKGFGGDLRFGEATGLAGADKICQTIAEGAGGGGKVWRAFLSVTKGPDGMPVHAINRIGNGPWYDRNGRLVSMDKAGLVAGNRPAGDPQIINDLPDETGQGTKRLGDTHDVITGSNRMGMLSGTSANDTCQDWTSVTVTNARVMCGHAWPAGSGQHWIQAHIERSCAAGVNLIQNGPGDGSSLGAGGGWGGFYCFALTP